MRTRQKVRRQSRAQKKSQSQLVQCERDTHGGSGPQCQNKVTMDKSSGKPDCGVHGSEQVLAEAPQSDIDSIEISTTDSLLEDVHNKSLHGDSSPADIRQYALDGNMECLREALYHGNSPRDEIFSDLARDNDPERAGVVLDAHNQGIEIPTETLKTLARHTDVDLRRDLGSRRLTLESRNRIPAVVRSIQLADTDADVRYYGAHYTMDPPEKVMKIAESHWDPEVRRTIVGNMAGRVRSWGGSDDDDKAMIATALKDPSPAVRASVANIYYRPTAEEVEAMSDDPEPTVRALWAKHGPLTEQALARLASDPDPTVRYEIAVTKTKRLTPDQQLAFAQDKDKEVRRAFVCSVGDDVDLPREVIDVMAKDSVFESRVFAACSNTRTTEDLEKMLDGEWSRPRSSTDIEPHLNTVYHIASSRLWENKDNFVPSDWLHQPPTNHSKAPEGIPWS